MTESITLTPADPADAPALARIADAAYALYVPRMGRRPAPMDADFPVHIRHGEVMVARDGDTPRGFIIFYGHGEVLHVANVAVDPAMQGHGIGPRLLAWAEAEAARRGLTGVELYTNIHMTENLRLYPRLGYRETGRRREDGFDRVFFLKQID